MVVSVTADGIPSLRTLPRDRLIDRAAEAIKDHILANQLQGGDRLPSEAELARSLGVSRNVVRQAVSSLSALGMVRVAQGRGIYVAEVADTDVFRQLAAWIDTSDLDDADYLAVRSIFERGIFELIIERASDEDLDRVEAAARAMHAATGDAEVQRLHDAFHQALLAATGNRFLLTLGTILMRFFWSVAANGPRVTHVPPAEMQESHLRLAALLRRRQPADIPAMIALHLGYLKA
jgi:GntR family transcriptional repressor for pyruvate dehydrogenase complex